MVLQSNVVRLSIGCLLYTSPNFSPHHTPFSLHLSLLSGLNWEECGGGGIGFLLLLNGDIETNPGPVGELSTRQMYILWGIHIVG